MAPDERDRRITQIPKARAVVSGPGLTLLVVKDERASRHALPASGVRVLGRSVKADIRVDDDSISREHAALHLGSDVIVEDLGSANGTWVRAQRLPPGGRAKLSAGESFRIGDAVVVLQGVASRPDALEGAAETAVASADVPSELAPVVVADAMVRLHEMADQVAAGTITVLILGETGVGKELLAQRIHARSARADGPCVTLNCAALSEPLLTSELFGHEKGAFTGADSAKIGLLEVANGGTVFFDEIGELPAQLQAKLLRVLEDRQVLPVGGRKARPVDLRFISATNRDLEADVAKGTFRRDLFFRLAGATLLVPPLRERVDEIEPLARHFLQQMSRQLGRSSVPELAPDALAALEAYLWPGNVRELRNMLERSLLLCGDGPVLLDHLPVEKLEATMPGGPPSGALVAAHQDDAREIDAWVPPGAKDLKALRGSLREAERVRIVEALEACAGNQTRAAAMLGISRRALVVKLGQYAIPRPRKA